MGSHPIDSLNRAREMAGTIEAHRQQLFKASAVLAVCKDAATSMSSDPEQLADALQVVYDLIDDVAGGLDELASAAREAQLILC